MTQQNQNSQIVSSPSQAPAQTKKIDVLKSMLKAPSVFEQFQNALSNNAPTFVASIIDLYNSDSKLQMCEPKAVVMEALKAAVLKLPINKALGYAYVIPFNNSKKKDDIDENGHVKLDSQGRPIQKWVKVMEPTFELGYKGYIQLAMRTGQYRTINADVVYDGELRKVNKLSGEIAFDGEKVSEKVIGYFCYFELLNGFSKTLYMTVEQMATHAKLYSKGIKAETSIDSLLNLANLPMTANSKTVGWMGNFHAMAIKTVIRNLLSKYGYLSIEMQQAIADDLKAENRDDIIAENANGTAINLDDANYEDVTDSDATTQTSNQASDNINPGF